MNSQSLVTHDFLQPSALLNILHLHYIQEQLILEKINTITSELNQFIKNHYSFHLDQNFKIGMFTLDKDQAHSEHLKIISLYKMTHKRIKNLSAASPILKLITEIKNNTPDQQLKTKLTELDSEGFIFEISQKFYGSLKSLGSSLLTIIMHNKAIIHDHETINKYHSQSLIAFSYHQATISQHIKFLESKCLEILKNSVFPSVIANSIITYIKQFLDKSPSQKIQHHEVLFLFKKQLMETEQLEKPHLDETLFTEIINTLSNDVSTPTLNEFLLKLQEPGGLAHQILTLRASNLAARANQLIQKFQHSPVEENPIQSLNQFSLFILCLQINADIEHFNDLFNEFSYANINSYFKKMSSMTPYEQEASYLTLLLGLQFIERLKYLEKTHFADLHHEELTDNQAKLFSTQHLNRIDWYPNCLQQVVYQAKENASKQSSLDFFINFENKRAQLLEQSEERELEKILREEGIPIKHPKENKTEQAPTVPTDTIDIDCGDVLNRTPLFNFIHFDLMDCFLDHNLESFFESLDLNLEKHITEHLNSSKFKDYQVQAITKWKSLLAREFEQFKNQLSEALNVLKTGHDEDCDPTISFALQMMKTHMPIIACLPDSSPKTTPYLNMV